MKTQLFTLLNTRSNYRLKNNIRGAWNKDILGGIFQKINNWGDTFIRGSRVGKGLLIRKVDAEGFVIFKQNMTAMCVAYTNIQIPINWGQSI